MLREPDDHVVALLEGREERRQVVRIVGQVGVHLEEPLVALGEPALEGVDIGGAQPELAGPVHHLDPRVVLR